METLHVNLPNTLLLTSLIYGISLSTILLVKNSQKRNAHFWLGVFILSFSAQLISVYFGEIHLHHVFPITRFANYQLLTLPPFLLWIYIIKLTNKKFNIQCPEKWMLGLISIDFTSQLYSLIVSEMKFKKLISLSNTLFSGWLDILAILMSLLVLLNALNVLKKYNYQLQNNYSSTEETKKLQWLKEILIVFTCFLILYIIVYPLNIFFFDWNLSPYWVWLSDAIIIFYLGIRGHLQPEIFHEFLLAPPFQQPPDNKKTLDNPQTVTKRSNLPSNEIKVQLNIIEQAMTEQKLYRQPKLNLRQMAKSVDLSPRQVSSLINQNHACSFSDFINKHRVEEVKQRIQQKDDQQLTLEALAFEAGFNSKSSFYFMFKKFTGVSPTEFKQKLPLS